MSSAHFPLTRSSPGSHGTVLRFNREEQRVVGVAWCILTCVQMHAAARRQRWLKYSHFVIMSKYGYLCEMIELHHSSKSKKKKKSRI